MSQCLQPVGGRGILPGDLGHGAELSLGGAMLKEEVP